MPTIFDSENDESIEITDKEVNSIFPLDLDIEEIGKVNSLCNSVIMVAGNCEQKIKDGKRTNTEVLMFLDKLKIEAEILKKLLN